MLRTAALALCALFALASPAAAQRIALVGATLIDGNGGAPIADSAIVLNGDRIEAIGPRASVRMPRGVRVVDVAGRWITPGLIDAHVHFFQSGGLYTRPDAIDLRSFRAYGEDLAWSKANLDTTFARYLASGVTTVVDCGGPLWNFEMRARARTLGARAPRVAAAGPLIATEPTRTAVLNEGGDAPIISATSVEHAREMTRALLPRRPDFIKIWGIGTGPDGVQHVREITAAVAEIAHAANTRVAVHATDLEVARAAVESGADILVHSVEDAPVDQAFIDALRARNVVYITTAMVVEGYLDAVRGYPDLTPIERAMVDPSHVASLYEAPPQMRAASRRRPADRELRQRQENALALVRAGARVAAGTDAGNIGTLHGGAIHRELELLVAAGLTPMQVIVSATRDAAYAYAPNPDVGVLRRGARADLLVLSADPLADIANMTRIERVYARGIAHDPWSLMPPSPEAIVQRQLERYNAHDLDGFVAAYAENAEFFDLPGATTPTMSGRDQIRRRYGDLFSRTQVNCQIVDRIVEGAYVIDQELCDVGEGRPRARATAIYQVENSLIRRVWFAFME